MNNKVIVVYFLMLVLLVACQPSTSTAIPTEKPILTETPTMVLASFPTNTSSPVATFEVAPELTATPLIASINTDEELETLLEQVYPFCIGVNDVKSTTGLTPTHLEYIEVDIQPDSKTYWISQIADNADKSLQAFVACKPELCHEQIYVKDNKTGKVYEIDWEFRMPWRPIQRVVWINNDTLVFFQSANPSRGTIKAINFSEKEYLGSWFIIADGQSCPTSTPNP